MYVSYLISLLFTVVIPSNFFGLFQIEFLMAAPPGISLRRPPCLSPPSLSTSTLNPHSQVLQGSPRHSHTCAHSYSCSQVLLIHSHPFCILQSLLSVHIPNSHSIPEIILQFRTIYQVIKWPKKLHDIIM